MLSSILKRVSVAEAEATTPPPPTNGQSQQQNVIDLAIDAALVPLNGHSPPTDTHTDEKLTELSLTVYDLIRSIRDPEKPQSLEELDVVTEQNIEVQQFPNTEKYHITVRFNPTVPHCSLATLIGLCLRVKLERELCERFKLDIYIEKGKHETEEEINKQINDKERVAAAMENPNLRSLVESCIKEDE